MVSNKTFVIAEIRVNHNGSVKTAKKLILCAKKNKADAVKFQSFNADRLAFKHTPKVKSFAIFFLKLNFSNSSISSSLLKKLLTDSGR